MLTSHKIQNEPATSLLGSSSKGQALPLEGGASADDANFFTKAFTSELAERSAAIGKTNPETEISKAAGVGLLEGNSVLDKVNQVASVETLSSTNMPLQNQPADILPTEIDTLDSAYSGLPSAMSAKAVQATPFSEFTNELDRGISDSINVNESGEKNANVLPFGYQVGAVNEEAVVNDLVIEEDLSEFTATESINMTPSNLHNIGDNSEVKGEVSNASPQKANDALLNTMENEQGAINPSAASIAAANTANTAVAGNVVNADKPLNSLNGQSTGLNQQTSWGAQSAEAGQAANSGNQNSSNQNSASSQSFAGNQQMAQQMVQQQEQKSQALNQQAALKMGEELAAKTETKDISLTGDFGATGDRRQTLPIGLQAINVPVKSPQWSQAVAHRVSFMANNQIQQAQITLNPEKLGPIQIRLQIDRDQQVQVSMLASQTTTREALEAAMPRLREMLEQSGMNLVSVDISDEKQFAEQQSEQTHSDSSASQLNENSEQSDEGMVAVKSVETDNIVDYYA